MIIQLTENMYEKTYRGRVYTLVRFDLDGGWFVWNKLLNGRANPPKPFDSLEQVEQHYKLWRGIKALVECSV